MAELGGAQTIGVMILDEAFTVPQAPPQNRLHRRAAQEVLKQLLPEDGVLIKGHMSSRSTLLDASGYSDRPGEFEELMWILDHELRLVTPAVPWAALKKAMRRQPSRVRSIISSRTTTSSPTCASGCSATGRRPSAAGRS